MPKMFVHSRHGTFFPDARAEIASALTELGMACERLSDTPAVRKAVWVFFTEHASDAVFNGGQLASDPTTVLIVYALEGGLDEASRRRLIKDATSILGEHAVDKVDPPPVFVVIREVPEIDWGMYGNAVSLATLRADG